MPWSGGSYTKGNNATGGWTGDASLGIGIEAGRHDTQDNDFATGINQCLNKDGSNAATGPLNAGGFKLTNVADATVTTDATTLRQVQAQAYIWCGTSGGTSTAYTISLTPAITAYAAGQVIRWVAHATVTGAATININGLGTKTLQRQGTALAGNEFKTGDIVEIVYNGTEFQVTSVVGAPLFIDRTNNRVGIGVTAPQEDLHIKSAAPRIRLEDTDGAGHLAQISGNFGTGSIAIQADVGNTGAASLIQFDVDGSIKATIDTGGLNVNTTNLGTFLSVAGNNTNFAAKFTSTQASDEAAYPLYIQKTANTNSGTNNFIRFTGSSTQFGYITGTTGGVSVFSSSSDRRLKENITDLPSQLANIVALRPVEFDFKDGSGHAIGFIAQEVQSIYPDNVAENENGFLNLLGMSRMDARLIKAIQDLNAKVEALEARVAELEG